MTQGIEKFEQHPIHSTLRTLESLLDDIDVGDFKKQINAIADYERIRQVLDITKKRLGAADPNLVPIQQLKKLDAQFQSIVGEVTALASDKNIVHLSNTNSHIENILVHINDIYIPIQTTDIEGLRDAVTSYKRSVHQYVRNIEDQSNAVQDELQKRKNDLDGLASDINSQKQRVDTVISSFQEQFSAAEAERRTDSKSAANQLKATSDALFETKKNEWDKLIKEKNEAYHKLLRQTQGALEDLHQSLKSQADSIINEIQDGKKKAEDLVGIITDTGMVGGYQRIANEEKLSGTKWRVVAALSLAALVLFALYAFIATLNQDVKWSAFGARLFVATALGILSAYAALQADKHQRTERKNRRIELELASISPYLHALPTDIQHKVKEELAMRLFGQADSLDGKLDKKTTGSALDLLRMALESIETLSKK